MHMTNCAYALTDVLDRDRVSQHSATRFKPIVKILFFGIVRWTPLYSKIKN